MPGQGQQRLPEVGIPWEPLGPVYQPQVQLVIQHPRLAHQLRVVALRVINQVARMHLEELRQQLARGVGQVWPRAAFNLRQVGLAHGSL